MKKKKNFRKSCHFDQNITNSNRETTNYDRYNNYKRTKGKDINTSSFYDSPKNSKKRKNIPGSDIQRRRFKVKKQSFDSEDN